MPCINWVPFAWLLIKRDFSNQYRGGFIGLGWGVLTPIFLWLAYALVFFQIFRFRATELHLERSDFVIFLFSGMVIFTFFSTVIVNSSTVLRANKASIKKIVAPISCFPLTTVAVSLCNFFISFGLIVLASLLFGQVTLINCLYLLPALIAMFAFGLALSFFISATSVYFTDLANVTKILVTPLMFLSPVFYPTSVIPEKFRDLSYLNPLVIPIETLRASFAGGSPPTFLKLLLYIVIGFTLCILSFWYFRKLKIRFFEFL